MCLSSLAYEYLEAEIKARITGQETIARRQKIVLSEVAKCYFDELGMKKLPSIKGLKQAYIKALLAVKSLIVIKKLLKTLYFYSKRIYNIK